jgi:hypothetical protein
MACVRSGFDGASVDVGAALALITAQGVPGAVAAQLLTAFDGGMRAGAAEWK